ncbi:MAG: DoxX family protein [Chitinophagaceae bacterium]|nr:DoxX family protein [Oligoflexus sp.]
MLAKLLFLPNTKRSLGTRPISIAFLLLRIAVGLIFVSHGWHKILAPMSWMPEGSSVPGFFQALGALAEFGGGIALMLGALTPLVSLGFICTMIGAIAFHIARGEGFQVWELAFSYLLLSIVFLFTGPGRYSFDAFMNDKFRR